MIRLPEDKVIITVAQTGALVFKSMNPNVPEQPEEIADSAMLAARKGLRFATFMLGTRKANLQEARRFLKKSMNGSAPNVILSFRTLQAVVLI